MASKPGIINCQIDSANGLLPISVLSDKIRKNFLSELMGHK